MATTQDEPFTFLDSTGRPFKAAPWGQDGDWWLFAWDDGQKSWFSLRATDQAYDKGIKTVNATLFQRLWMKRFLWRERAMPENEAKKYDELHERNEPKFNRNTGGKT